MKQQKPMHYTSEMKTYINAKLDEVLPEVNNPAKWHNLEDVMKDLRQRRKKYEEIQNSAIG